MQLVTLYLTSSLALRLMFCAGWVHRDISVGNILAIKDENGDWKIKLADLEYPENEKALILDDLW